LGQVAKPAVPTLLACLADVDSPIATEAAYTLCSVSPEEAAAAVPVIIQSMKSGVLLSDCGNCAWYERRRLRCLLKLGPTAIPLLVKGLKDENTRVRFGCLVALGDFGPAANSAVPQLVEFLNCVPSTAPVLVCDNPVRFDVETPLDDHILQFQAIWTLWSIEKKADTIVPKLIDILSNDKTEAWREHAAAVLGFLGPKARAAVPSLIKALEDTDSVHCAAAEALEKVDPEAARKAGIE